MPYTLPTDQLSNLEFQFESVFNLEFQAKFGIQLGIPIPMGINLGECMFLVKMYYHLIAYFSPLYIEYVYYLREGPLMMGGARAKSGGKNSTATCLEKKTQLNNPEEKKIIINCLVYHLVAEE